MPLTHSLVFSFRAILKKSSDFYKVSQEILKSLIRFFKMACSKEITPSIATPIATSIATSITRVFIPGCHRNQANLETLQKFLAEAGIPCKIHSVERKESPYNDMFFQLILCVSFALDSEKIQEEIRAPSGMKVYFYLDDGSTKHLVLKEYR